MSKTFNEKRNPLRYNTSEPTVKFGNRDTQYETHACPRIFYGRMELKHESITITKVKRSHFPKGKGLQFPQKRIWIFYNTTLKFGNQYETHACPRILLFSDRIETWEYYYHKSKELPRDNFIHTFSESKGLQFPETQKVTKFVNNKEGSANGKFITPLELLLVTPQVCCKLVAS